MASINHCHVMAKPSSSQCNIDCHYCFYLEKEKLYPDQTKHSNWMNDETLDLFIRQHIEAQASDHVVFAWQGGEPCLMGLDFFKKAVALQKQYAKGKSIENTFQTNGLLINDAWCEFFAKHQFLVGISLDGPEHLHDTYRKTRSGKGTYQKVIRAIQCFQKHGVTYNTLSVVSQANYKHALEVYQHLKSLGSDVHQYIPLVERQKINPFEGELILISPDHQVESEIAAWSVPAEGYGRFLVDIFNYWVKHDVGRVFVPMFENMLAIKAKQGGNLCTQAPSCGSAFALESNGDLYNCDHYVYPENKLGNIYQTTIKAMNQSQQNIEFGQKKSTQLSNDCKQCRFIELCYGGCPKHRFMPTSQGETIQNYLCPSYKKLFQSTESKIEQMVQLWQQGFDMTSIMNIR